MSTAIVITVLFIAAVYGIWTLLTTKSADITPSSGDMEWSKCESPIESRVYNALRYRGHYVRTQVPCGKYRIDIVLPHYRLAIECDGKDWHSSPEQKAHDRRKDAYLRKQGYSVMRISGSQINGNMKGVIKRIENKIEKYAKDSVSK
jgi:very-short-patch-repair endonuclease